MQEFECSSLLERRQKTSLWEWKSEIGKEEMPVRGNSLEQVTTWELGVYSGENTAYIFSLI
jgi:hypothetical protein